MQASFARIFTPSIIRYKFVTKVFCPDCFWGSLKMDCLVAGRSQCVLCGDFVWQFVHLVCVHHLAVCCFHWPGESLSCKIFYISWKRIYHIFLYFHSYKLGAVVWIEVSYSNVRNLTNRPTSHPINVVVMIFIGTANFLEKPALLWRQTNGMGFVPNYLATTEADRGAGWGARETICRRLTFHSAVLPSHEGSCG